MTATCDPYQHSAAPSSCSRSPRSRSPGVEAATTVAIRAAARAPRRARSSSPNRVARATRSRTPVPTARWASARRDGLDKDRVLKQIESGGGAMPPKILEGKDAEAVADYVAAQSADRRLLRDLGGDVDLPRLDLFDHLSDLRLVLLRRCGNRTEPTPSSASPYTPSAPPWNESSRCS